MASKLDYPRRHAGLFRMAEPMLTQPANDMRKTKPAPAKKKAAKRRRAVVASRR